MCVWVDIATELREPPSGGWQRWRDYKHFLCCWKAYVQISWHCDGAERTIIQQTMKVEGLWTGIIAIDAHNVCAGWLILWWSWENHHPADDEGRGITSTWGMSIPHVVERPMCMQVGWYCNGDLRDEYLLCYWKTWSTLFCPSSLKICPHISMILNQPIIHATLIQPWGHTHQNETVHPCCLKGLGSLPKERWWGAVEIGRCRHVDSAEEGGIWGDCKGRGKHTWIYKGGLNKANILAFKHNPLSHHAVPSSLCN